MSYRKLDTVFPVVEPTKNLENRKKSMYIDLQR